MSTRHHQRTARPLGTITRGTTGRGRLRRVDTWMLQRFEPLLRASHRPVVVDLGFGARPTTTLELHRRVMAIQPRASVVGVEIEPERVSAAQSDPSTQGLPGLSFRHGGFELGHDAALDRGVTLIRAFNVLRQYDESHVTDAWSVMRRCLVDRGVIVEGTCDEAGRRLSWVVLDANGPRTLTLAADLSTLDRPSELAERLPKALIHRNVPGEPVHALLRDWDAAWDRAVGLAVFGVRGRWVRSALALREAGWPLVGGPAAWSRGAVTLRWSAVGPQIPGLAR